MILETSKSSINYKIVGEGIPVLMLHGFPLDHTVMYGAYEPIFHRLEGFKRIYVDLPAMGDSKAKDGLKTSGDIFQCVIELIDEVIKEDKFIVVGQSYGGYLAQAIVAKIPEKTIGISLLCPMVISDYETRKLPKHRVFFKDDEFLDKLSSDDKEDFISMAVVASEHTYNRYVAEIQPGLKKADYSILDNLREKHYGLEPDPGTEIRKYDEPALFLLGKQDSGVGYQDVLDMEHKFSAATTVIINGAGHGLQFEQVDIFNSLNIMWFSQFL